MVGLGRRETVMALPNRGTAPGSLPPGRGIVGEVALVSACTVAMAMLWWSRLRYWYPHDEGLLGQSALRVMGGMVPHRDFDHPYTGADAVVHGAFLTLLGNDLAAIRNGFAAVASLWLVAVAWLVRRTASAGVAALAVLVIGAWGPAMYPAAMASWYVTMLIVIAVLCLSGPEGATNRASVVAAGFFVGLAVGFKVTGLYAVVGIGVWLIAFGTRNAATGARPWAVVLLIGALVLPVLAIGATPSIRVIVHLLMPPIVVTTGALALELRRWSLAGLTRGFDGLGALLLFGMGVAGGAAPVGVWLATSGGLLPFIESVAGAGGLRTAFAAMPPPRLVSLAHGASAMLLVVAAARGPRVREALFAVLGMLLLWLAASSVEWQRIAWSALRGAMPVALVLISAHQFRRRNPGGAVLSLICTVLGWMLLTQFPFAAPIYFVYVVPFAVLALICTASLTPGGRRATVGLSIWLAAFGYLQLLPNPISVRGYHVGSAGPLATLPGIRGGLLVESRDSILYGDLITALDRIVPGPIWAGPDAPEVGFLAGRVDRNRRPFEFLAPQGKGSHVPFDSVVAVVINDAPDFSPPFDEGARAAIGRRFPMSVTIGSFTVFHGGP